MHRIASKTKEERKKNARYQVCLIDFQVIDSVAIRKSAIEITHAPLNTFEIHLAGIEHALTSTAHNKKKKTKCDVKIISIVQKR